MTRTQKISAYLFAICISQSSLTHAAEFNSIDSQANYTAQTTYRELSQ